MESKKSKDVYIRSVTLEIVKIVNRKEPVDDLIESNKRSSKILMTIKWRRI